MALSFKIWRRDDEPARDIAKEIAEDERELADKRAELDHIVSELATPGLLLPMEHEGFIADKPKVEAAIVRLTNRIELGRADLVTAERRDRDAARDARIAEAPAIAKRANKRLVEIDKTARALAALLAEQAADQDAYGERVRDARDAGRELPRLYADRDVAAVIEPAKTVHDEKWMVKRPVNNGTVQEPIWAEYWTGCGLYHQDASGRMVPSDPSAVLRKAPRVIPEKIVEPARYFESPTATTIIAGHWPRA